MKKIVIAVTVITALIAWSCSKLDTSSSGGLRQSIENGVSGINNAVTTITGTTGYKILSLNAANAKSDVVSINNDSISLSQVAGVYDFQPDTVMRFNNFCPFMLFKKTDVSADIIVNLPEMLIMHPRHLFLYAPKDTVYPNNFTITATDYHLYYNWWSNFDYKLTAGLKLNNADAGSMDVATTSTSPRTLDNLSSFAFPDGYKIAETWQTGDTASSSFSLSKNSDTLFKENSIFIWQGLHNSEKFYDLTIGNVEIKKTSGIDSIQVFVSGVLQKKAASIITDGPDSTASVCRKRDFLLTFDDGTTSKLSTLMQPVKDELQSLRDAIHSMYFSQKIVNYIAFSIYYNTHQYHY